MKPTKHSSGTSAGHPVWTLNVWALGTIGQVDAEEVALEEEEEEEEAVGLAG